MKRFFSLVIFAGLLGLGINLSAQQSPSTTQDQAGAQQQTPSSTDQSGAAQDTTTSQQPVDAQSQQAARSFEGMINKAKGKYVLQDPSTQTSYQLDDQEKASQFAGQTVKVMATMDPTTNTLHVVDISASSK
jgi:hypothetical protein